MQVSNRVLIAVLGVAVALIMAVEATHFARYGHFFGCGWHVDAVSERADYGIAGLTQVQFGKLTKLYAVARSHGIVRCCYRPRAVQHRRSTVPNPEAQR